MFLLSGVWLCLLVIPDSSTASKIIYRPGSCPVASKYQGACHDICLSDSGCPYPQKCCHTEKCHCKVCIDVCGYPRLCDKTCPDGFKIGPDGCELCECIDVCEDVKCPPRQKCVPQKKSCRTGDACKRVGVCECVPQKCRMYCRDGFKKDSNGCEMCECRDICEGIICPKGKKCEPQELASDVVPPPRKPVCVPDCDDFICALFCEDGFQKDQNGCPICKCVDVCEDVKCPPRQKCVPQKKSCRTGDKCRRVGVCECEPQLCEIACRDGFKKDSNGCELCECKDPCEGHKCPRGTHCVVVKHHNCAPKPSCVPHKGYK